MYIDIFESYKPLVESLVLVSCPVKFIHVSVSPFNHGSHFLFYFDNFVSSALCPILLPPSCLIVCDYCHLRVLLCSLLLTGLMCINGAISVSVLFSASFNVFCMSHSVLIFLYFQWSLYLRPFIIWNKGSSFVPLVVFLDLRLGSDLMLCDSLTLPAMLKGQMKCKSHAVFHKQMCWFNVREKSRNCKKINK